MAPAHLNIDKTRRVSLTLGASIAVVAFAGGAGVTWGTMRSDIAGVAAKNIEQDARLKKIEEIPERLARMEGKLDMLIKGAP